MFSGRRNCIHLHNLWRQDLGESSGDFDGNAYAYLDDHAYPNQNAHGVSERDSYANHDRYSHSDGDPVGNGDTNDVADLFPKPYIDGNTNIYSHSDDDTYTLSLPDADGDSDIYAKYHLNSQPHARFDRDANTVDHHYQDEHRHCIADDYGFALVDDHPVPDAHAHDKRHRDPQQHILADSHGDADDNRDRNGHPNGDIHLTSAALRWRLRHRRRGDDRGAGSRSQSGGRGGEPGNVGSLRCQPQQPHRDVRADCGYSQRAYGLRSVAPYRLLPGIPPSAGRLC